MLARGVRAGRRTSRCSDAADVDDGAGAGAVDDEAQRPGRDPAEVEATSTRAGPVGRVTDRSRPSAGWTPGRRGPAAPGLASAVRRLVARREAAAWVRPPGNAVRTGGRSIPNGSLGGRRVAVRAGVDRHDLDRRRPPAVVEAGRGPSRSGGPPRRRTRGGGTRRHPALGPVSTRRHDGTATTGRTRSTGRRRHASNTSDRHRASTSAAPASTTTSPCRSAGRRRRSRCARAGGAGRGRPRRSAPSEVGPHRTATDLRRRSPAERSGRRSRSGPARSRAPASSSTTLRKSATRSTGSAQHRAGWRSRADGAGGSDQIQRARQPGAEGLGVLHPHAIRLLFDEGT